MGRSRNGERRHRGPGLIRWNLQAPEWDLGLWGEGEREEATARCRTPALTVPGREGRVPLAVTLSGG